MKKILRKWKVFLLPCLALIATFGIVHNAGKVSATNTPQPLPFSQNWTNAGLITANDDWSGVPGIVGFLGNYDPAATTNVDPRTLLAPFATNDVDVIANQASVALTNGGVAEFDGIANPVVALQGSGTADAPSIVIYVNTTGLGNIQFSCNIRDIDDSADNSAQQVDVQYRVGGAGDYASVTGGYIADASSGPSTTMSTPLNLTLPAAANNQSQVEIRVITTNAVGSDEWVGVDDINVTGSPAVAADAPLDFNGDGKTDYGVTRNIVFQKRWFYNINGTGALTVLDWGLNSDVTVPEDYDGDGKDDVAVWREGAPGNSFFYILQSQSNSVRIVNFGQNGDDATVVGDYDGDGKSDPAVYRSGSQGTWFYLGSLSNPSNNITYVPWGTSNDRATPGDFDGDGKFDFAIRRAEGGSARFWINRTTAGITTQIFGFFTDIFVPGDYDGDTKTDLAVARIINGPPTTFQWFYQPSAGGGIVQLTFGDPVSDFPAQGDYDGDGKTDVGIWRNTGIFWTRNSSNAAIQAFQLGAGGDEPAGKYNYHLGP